MINRKLFISALVITLTACSADKSEKDPQFAAAEQCAKTILTESKAQAAKGISGQYKFTSIPRATSAHDGAFVSTEVRSVPYATSTYLDNGVEGSAWRKCMEKTIR
ncbi:hypothetical protein EKO17_21025 [Enterobacter hormaechei subsp. xiangfangensis]|jgi:hypothetical protein|uniref:hypothetical protein n=1 Tax=Enterobacter hormaechei TaxID=158836 RepID=UPI000F83D4E7|nr:hypothetical protein [Enterobacter hormaechei]MCC2917691.1 hypothetical protein [Enterobacter hormaechei]RTM58778.1 hypothetical protein EKO17_21025 [Enterobacter hormaechei subsp. xiangfangensis]UDV15072.1 hypothetical protein LJU47_22075 [Enterobacter hormaechei]